MTTFKRLTFEVHVSSKDPRNLSWTEWRTYATLKRMDLAVKLADKITKEDAERDRSRVVRVESTCTVVHEPK